MPASASPADAVPRRYTCGMLVEAQEFQDTRLIAILRPAIMRQFAHMQDLEAEAGVPHGREEIRNQAEAITLNAVYYACSHGGFPASQPVGPALAWPWVTTLAEFQHVHIDTGRLNRAVAAWIRRIPY